MARRVGQFEAACARSAFRGRKDREDEINRHMPHLSAPSFGGHRARFRRSHMAAPLGRRPPVRDMHYECDAV